MWEMSLSAKIRPCSDVKALLSENLQVIPMLERSEKLNQDVYYHGLSVR